MARFLEVAEGDFINVEHIASIRCGVDQSDLDDIAVATLPRLANRQPRSHELPLNKT
jgi:hypothetical protein